MKKKVHDPGGPGSPAARKKTKNSAESRRKEREGEPKGGRSYVEGSKKDGCTTRRR